MIYNDKEMENPAFFDISVIRQIIVHRKFQILSFSTEFISITLKYLYKHTNEKNSGCLKLKNVDIVELLSLFSFILFLLKQNLHKKFVLYFANTN